MKKNLRTVFYLFVPFAILSCSDSDSPAPHEVGTWELEGYELTNFANDFSGFEGSQWSLNELIVRGVILESSDLILNEDGTFEERLKPNGGTTEVFTGTYTKQDTTLITLSYTDADVVIEQSIERNSNDLLRLGVAYQIPLISRTTADALIADFDGDADAAQDFLDSLQTADFDEFFSYFSVANCTRVDKYVRGVSAN